jgi:hypothetical protein
MMPGTKDKSLGDNPGGKPALMPRVWLCGWKSSQPGVCPSKRPRYSATGGRGDASARLSRRACTNHQAGRQVGGGRVHQLSPFAPLICLTRSTLLTPLSLHPTIPPSLPPAWSLFSRRSKFEALFLLVVRIQVGQLPLSIIIPLATPEYSSSEYPTSDAFLPKFARATQQ